MKAILVAILVYLALSLGNAAPSASAVQHVVCFDNGQDHVRINTAIGNLPDTGGEVQLPDGKCSINGPIIIQDKPVHLRGRGTGWAHADGITTPLTGGTIITADATYNDDFIQVKSTGAVQEGVIRTAGTMISNLKIYQPFPTTSPNATGIHTFGNCQGEVGTVNNVTIQNVSISGVGGFGISLGGGENWVNTVTVRGAYYGGILLDCGDSIIANATLGGNGRSGTHDGLVINGGTSAISNIYAYGNGRHGINWEAGRAVVMGTIVAEANHGWGVVVDVGVSGSSLVGVVTSANDLGGLLNLGTNVQVTGWVSVDGK